MKIQRICLEPHHYSWLVLDDDHLPIKPIESFLRYLYYTEKSPHTVRAYAHHLKLFWEFLVFRQKAWDQVGLNDFAHFVYWLRTSSSNVVYLVESEMARRTESTVNTTLSALSSFYRYHHQLGNTRIQFTQASHLTTHKYKSLLYHIFKNRPMDKRLISLKQPKVLPPTLSRQQALALADACVNGRDRFLILLLYETGLRIGQALALRHEDIKSWDNEIHVLYRKNNRNQVRNKTMKANVLPVSTSLMQWYSDYVLAESQAAESEYVFVNFPTGAPMGYGPARKLFARLSKKAGFHATPHMLRHTHASELIRAGWDASLVQKRLGHASVQTTLDIYSHVNQEDLKHAFEAFQAHQAKKEGLA